MTILITGAAGFIGSHVAEALLARGERVIGVDNLNDYYDVGLKRARVDRLRRRERFAFHRVDVADQNRMSDLITAYQDIDRIVHLAAQAGVRYSMVDPHSYVTSNVMGHLVIAEAAKSLPSLKHFVYASSSSVYGASEALPYAEADRADRPLSLYAATKRAAELISYAYGHLFAIPQTGLRFFTVYGPWGRPDMAYYAFARAIMAGVPLPVYDGGRLRRDFTYIDDVVTAVLGVLDRPPSADDVSRVLNIGNHGDESVGTLIRHLASALGREAVIHDVPRPLADVPRTLANVERIGALTGFAPSTPLAVGIARFAEWFKDWHALSGAEAA